MGLFSDFKDSYFSPAPKPPDGLCDEMEKDTAMEGFRGFLFCWLRHM